MKILLIEDSKTLRRIIGGYVQNAGYSLETAETGEVALQLLESNRFDLILSDVDMPGLGGFDTVRLIREMLGEHWVPIIFLTSRDEDEDYIEGFDAGGDDYIVKPIREVVLQGKIRVMERFINMQNKLYEVLSQPEPPSQLDRLTQTYNSASFLHLADIQWSVLVRRNEPVSIVIVDIDYFSEYRNVYGKEKRDECLQKVARAIQDAAQRPNDFIGRLNKHDFVLMLPGTEESGVFQVATRIVELVEGLSIEHRKSPLSSILSVSIAGICCSDLESYTVQAVLNKATSLLHKVKYSDGDPVCIHEI